MMNKGSEVIEEYVEYLSGGEVELRECQEEDKGRGLFYSGEEGLGKGVVVLSSPHLGLARGSRGGGKEEGVGRVDHCAECNREEGEEGEGSWITCAFCQVRKYCQVKCQRLNWYRLHQLECSLLKTDYVRDEPGVLKCRIQLLRSYWLMVWCHHGELDRKLWIEGDDRRKVTSVLLKVFESLPSHSDGFYPKEVRKEMEVIVTLVQQQLGWIWVNHPKLKYSPFCYEPTLEKLSDTLKVFSNNNFSLVDSELSEVGEGTFPIGSLINHSCQPNCYITNHFLPTQNYLTTTTTNQGNLIDHGNIEPTQAIITLRTIQPGEELTIGYIDPIYNTELRRGKLLEHYHFTCHCPRCSTRQSHNGITETDPNFLIFRKLLPSTVYLDWEYLLSMSLSQLQTTNLLSIKVYEILSEWDHLIPNGSTNLPLSQLFTKSNLKVNPIKVNPITKYSNPFTKYSNPITEYNNPITKYSNPFQLPSHLLEYQTSLSTHFNNLTTLLCDSNLTSSPTTENESNSNSLPLPQGKDLLVYLNLDLPTADPPPNWLGPYHLTLSPSYPQLVGRIVSTTFQLLTYHRHYPQLTPNSYPILGLRLIELGKLWFNLAPSLARHQPPHRHHQIVLGADYLALHYLTLALTYLPKSSSPSPTTSPTSTWSHPIPLLTNLLHTLADLKSELHNLTSD